jgi:hypothetical protein
MKSEAKRAKGSKKFFLSLLPFLLPPALLAQVGNFYLKKTL